MREILANDIYILDKYEAGGETPDVASARAVHLAAKSEREALARAAVDGAFTRAVHLVARSEREAFACAAVDVALARAVPSFLREEALKNVRRIHTSLPDYEPTPLYRLDGLSRELGVKAVFVKDESKRFGLNAFKGLGGIYAMTMLIAGQLGLDADKVTFDELTHPKYRERISNMTFATATDGNHGKGISWAAGLLGCEAHIFMPAGSSERRAQAIRDVNPRANVLITDMNYDDTVRYAVKLSAQNGWHLVQDTSWENYEEIPTWIVQGYTTMAAEALQQMETGNFETIGLSGGEVGTPAGEAWEPFYPTHVLLQAGVGAMSGGVAGYLAGKCDSSTHTNSIFIATVEPENVACIYESAKAGDGCAHPAPEVAAAHDAPVAVGTTPSAATTIMAGLNCGEPCLLTWPVLRDLCNIYIKCPDEVSREGMRYLASAARPSVEQAPAHPSAEQAAAHPFAEQAAAHPFIEQAPAHPSIEQAPAHPSIISGESGAVTIGILRMAAKPGYEKLKESLRLTPDSVVLCFSTEGDTDPDSYRNIVDWGGSA